MHQRLEIPVGKDVIAARVYYPPSGGAHPALFFFNGKGGTKDRFYSLGSRFVDKGYVSVCFDFRGRGESATDGVPPLSWQGQDAKAVAVRFLSLPHVDPQRLSIVATSMGMFATLTLLDTYPFERLFLFEPSIFTESLTTVPYLDIDASTIMTALQKDGGIYDIDALRRYRGEVYFFIHENSTYYSEMNQIFSFYSRLFVQAKNIQKIVIPHIGHAIFKTEHGRELAYTELAKILA